MIKVFGVTSDRQVVPVLLTEKEVAELQIHPWRVDLFEPDPIIRREGGRDLAFTRLQDLTFLSQDGDRGTLAICEGGKWKVFSGTITEGPKSCHSNGIWLKDLKVLESSPPALLISFLKKGWATHGTAVIAGEYSPFFKEGRLFYPQDTRYWTGDFYASPGFASRVSGYGYGGETFSEVMLHRAMPRQMLWALQSFQDWQPRVFGGSLRDLLLGNKEEDVDFIVDGKSQEDVSARLQTLGAKEIRNLSDTDTYGNVTGHPVFEFRVGRISYHLVCRGNFLADNFWLANDFSVNQLYAERPNEVVASRVALWDLAHSQTRLVSYARSIEDPHLVPRWRERAYRMEKKGFAVLSNPFANDEAEKFGR